MIGHDTDIISWQIYDDDVKLINFFLRFVLFLNFIAKSLICEKSDFSAKIKHLIKKNKTLFHLTEKILSLGFR